MITFSIDYLSFTIFNVDIEVLCQHLPHHDIVALDKGKLGYKRALLYKNIWILYDGKEDMGIHVDCSSKNLGYITDILDIPLLQGNVKYTRIDLACDVYNLSLFEDCYLNCKLHNFRTKRKKRSVIESFDTSTNKLNGRTIYFGSRVSSVYMRIYDKGLEQKVDEDWTRIELEIKGDSANNLAKLINSAPLDIIFFKIINNYFAFVDRTTCSNISRAPLLEFWEMLIKTDESMTVAPKKEEQSIDKTYTWLLKQVSRSLGKIAAADKKTNAGLIEGLIKIGEQKLSIDDVQQVQEFDKRRKHA